MKKKLADQLLSEGNQPNTRRYFIQDDELIHAKEKTFAVTKLWGRNTTKAMNLILKEFPDYEISYRESSANE